MCIKVRAVAYLLSLAMLFHTSPKEDNNSELDLYAQSAVLMDADSGRILYGKNEDEILANASTTKILTCILALELGDMNAFIKVSSNAAKMPKVHLGMKTGQCFKMEDLLYSLMLESHNDSAVAIAECIGGSAEDFGRLMNEKAKSIGCTDTYFITPNGLDAKAGERFHSTTAVDLAKIMSYCAFFSPKREEFLEICQTQNYVFTDYQESDNGYVSAGKTYSCNNKNSFLTMMDGVLAGKTGFTGKAGYCYVAALESEGRKFVISLLACGWPNNKNYKWSDAKELFGYGLEKYSYENILKEIQLSPLEVVGGIPYGLSKMPVYVSCDEESCFLLLDEKDKVEVKIYLPKKLKAPLAKNERVGKVEYLLNNEVVKEYQILTKSAVEEHTYQWSFWYILRKYIFL